MKDDLSDTQIRCDLRSVLTEHGFDPNRTNFICAQGVVRLLGELLAARDAPVQPAQVESLEHEIRRNRGVQRVHFHPTNFERLPSGQWKPVDPREKQFDEDRE